MLCAGFPVLLCDSKNNQAEEQKQLEVSAQCEMIDYREDLTLLKMDWCSNLNSLEHLKTTDEWNYVYFKEDIPRRTAGLGWRFKIHYNYHSFKR